MEKYVLIALAILILIQATGLGYGSGECTNCASANCNGCYSIFMDPAYDPDDKNQCDPAQKCTSSNLCQTRRCYGSSFFKKTYTCTTSGWMSSGSYPCGSMSCSGGYCSGNDRCTYTTSSCSKTCSEGSCVGCTCSSYCESCGTQTCQDYCLDGNSVRHYTNNCQKTCSLGECQSCECPYDDQACGTTNCPNNYCGGDGSNTPYTYPTTCQNGCVVDTCQPCTCNPTQATSCTQSQFCSYGECLTCSGSYKNCDLDSTNKCESNTQTDSNNCGNCGTQCKTNEHCDTGTCVCDTGYQLCGDTCYPTGTGICCNDDWYSGANMCCGTIGVVSTQGICCNDNWYAGGNLCCGDIGVDSTQGICCETDWYPDGNCCEHLDCAGHFACVGHSCSSIECEPYYSLCGGSCYVTGSGQCCKSQWYTEEGICCGTTWWSGGKCCSDNDCGGFLCPLQGEGSHICSGDCPPGEILCKPTETGDPTCFTQGTGICCGFVWHTEDGRCCADKWKTGGNACCTDTDCPPTTCTPIQPYTCTSCQGTTRTNCQGTIGTCSQIFQCTTASCTTQVNCGPGECCNQGTCYPNEARISSDTKLCDSGIWRECNTQNICNTYHGYYCDGNSWESGDGSTFVCNGQDAFCDICNRGRYVNYCDGQGSCSTNQVWIDLSDSECPQTLECGSNSCPIGGCEMSTSKITNYPQSTCTKYCNGLGSCQECNCDYNTVNLGITQYCLNSGSIQATDCPQNKVNCDLDSSNTCEVTLGTIQNCAACQDTCTGTGTPACCSGSCTDLDYDVNNCGTCTIACGSGSSCVNGECCKDVGQACTKASDCCSASCIGGLCKAAENCDNVNIGCQFSGRSGQCADDCSTGSCSTEKICCDASKGESIVIQTERYKCIKTYSSEYLGKNCYENWNYAGLGLEGRVRVSYDQKLGCCANNLCYTGTTCVNEGTILGASNMKICKEGVWEECIEGQWCSSITTGSKTYYCSPTGWDQNPSDACGLGICVAQTCKYCGSDVEVGKNLDKFYCTATGFKTRCDSDVDCADESECTIDTCALGISGADLFGCLHEPKSCGEECQTGVCNGEGECVTRKQVGEHCPCEICATGLTCNTKNSVCVIQSSCGNDDCDQGECITCPQDCSIGSCSGNSACDTLVGETCLNSPDCKCKSGKCDPLSEGAEEDGCVVSACGDGICLPTECSSCSLDCKPEKCLNSKCDINIGEDCDNSRDCICDVELDFGVEEIQVKSGIKNTISFTIKNTGNSKQEYTIHLGDGEVHTSWRKATVDLAPGQESLQQVEIWANEIGLHQLDLNITSGKIKFEEEIDIEVPAPDAVETTSGVLTLIFNLMNFWELVVVLVGTGATLKYLYWRFKSPHLVVRHDEPGFNSHFHNRFNYPQPNYQNYYRQNQPKRSQNYRPGSRRGTYQPIYPNFIK